MQEKRPNYYAVIPATVRYAAELKANEKLLYAEITALSNKDGYCWASNNYFAELFDVTSQTVSGWISNLVDQGYIYRELIKEGKQIKDRRLTPIKENLNTPIKEKLNTPIKENLKGNTTSINTTSTNKDREKVPYKEIKNLYNNICKSLPTVRKITDGRRRHIKARWKEEKSLATFEEVFKKAECSSFLTGDNDRNWKADFDWIIKNDTNFNKVLENKYNEKKDQQFIPEGISDEEVASYLEEFC